MKSVLEQLYDGEIYPAEQVNVRMKDTRKCAGSITATMRISSNS